MAAGDRDRIEQPSELETHPSGDKQSDRRNSGPTVFRVLVFSHHQQPVFHERARGDAMPNVLTEPTFRQNPTEVAPGTYVIHEVQHALGQPLSVYINSAVIKAEQPILIDTGSCRNRRNWLEDAFTLVDPQDVRWVFVSHEDADHVGNLDEVMAACPNAKLISSWALTERHTNAFDFPLERCRWMDDGATFDAGDRQMVVVRPPLYDSPTTRGLLDTKTGVYWAVDSFATPVPGGEGAEKLARDVAELDDAFWDHGMTMFAINALAPWLRLVDENRFGTEVDRFTELGISAIISAHSPAIFGDKVAEALAKVRGLPTAECPPAPDQAVLDLILAATRGA
ncbi:MAG: oxygen-binding di-iron domain-containing protein [Acidimicrobiales bacterium]